MTHVVRFLAGCLLLVAACSASPGDPNPEATPPGSAGHGLVYADDLEMMLLVNAGLGGTNPPPASTRTRIWGWNGARWSLIDSSGPPVRNLAGVAYNTRRHALVMHGGTYDTDRSYGETWEWSRKTGWRKFAGEGPGPRDHTQMAYDPERGECVLFGGSGADPNTAFTDTWEFDGVRWQRVAAEGPPARIHHVLAYDPSLHRVVTFGGATPGRGGLGDTWGWDGTRWTPAAPTTVPRTHASMAFDPRRNALVVVGGLRLQGIRMLERTGAGWALVPASSEPAARYLPSVAYDTKRGRLVLFGGGDPDGMDLFADTWEFDDTAWRRVGER